MLVKFLDQPLEADAQLREWGVDRVRLKEAVFFAHSYYNECTSNDPLGFDRVMAYARAARRLRDLYVGERDGSRTKPIIKLPFATKNLEFGYIRQTLMARQQILIGRL